MLAAREAHMEDAAAVECWGPSPAHPPCGQTRAARMETAAGGLAHVNNDSCPCAWLVTDETGETGP
jgi:hypothetical protein